MNHNIKIYEGTSPYAFVSYAHLNADRVIPIVKALFDRSYRVWYDSGIKSGDAWAVTIASRLKAAECIICFLSKEFCESHNCRNELLFALNKQITVMVVYLDDFVPPDDIELLIAQVHAIHMNRYESIDLFIADLEISKCFQKCKSVEDTSNPAAIYMNSAASYMKTNPKYAREAYRLAINIYESASNEIRQKYIIHLATAYRNHGKSYIDENRYKDAEPFCEKAVLLFEEIASSNDEYAPALASSYFNLCTVYHEQKTTAKLIKFTHPAIELYDRLCKNDLLSYGKSLVKLHLYLSDLFDSRQEIDSMEKEHREALKLLERLAAIDPDEYNLKLATAYHTLALRFIHALRLDDAMEICKKNRDRF